MKVAVVGSGLPGLVAARRLAERGCAVTVFERRAAPAVSAHTVRVQGRGYDTLLVWPRYHARLVAIAQEVGLGLVERPFGDTGFFAEGEGAPYFWYDSHDLGASKLVVPRARRRRDHLRIARAWLPEAMSLGRSSARSVGEHFGDTEDFWRFVFPWVCGCLGFPRAEMVLDCPLEAVRAFQALTLGEAPRMVEGGMEALATRLLEGVSFRPSTPVTALSDLGGFDATVLAVPPAEAARLSGVARLARIHQEPIRLYAHCDPGLLPPRRQDWRTVMYTVPRDRSRGVATTIWWSRVLGLSGPDLFFTWNPTRPPEHPLYQSELVRALPSVADQAFLREELPRLQGRGGVWFTGVWAQPGRGGYLEDGVVHAEQLMERLGA